MISTDMWTGEHFLRRGRYSQNSRTPDRQLCLREEGFECQHVRRRKLWVFRKPARSSKKRSSDEHRTEKLGELPSLPCPLIGLSVILFGTFVPLNGVRRGVVLALSLNPEPPSPKTTTNLLLWWLLWVVYPPSLGCGACRVPGVTARLEQAKAYLCALCFACLMAQTWFLAKVVPASGHLFSLLPRRELCLHLLD